MIKFFEGTLGLVDDRFKMTPFLIRFDAEVPFEAAFSMCEEAVVCRHHLDRMYSKFPHVYCHQDLWMFNIIYDDKKGEFYETMSHVV